MASKRAKAAANYSCQSKDQVMEAIRTLGDAQRELVRIETEVNDQIAEITASRKSEINAQKERCEVLMEGIQGWCEANRATLCASGLKTANLVTGEVSWRQRPPSVAVRGLDKVIDTLKALNLGRFIRTKEELNKEAMLADPKSVSGISGITIVSGVEDFIVTPFEVEVTA